MLSFGREQNKNLSFLVLSWGWSGWLVGWGLESGLGAGRNVFFFTSLLAVVFDIFFFFVLFFFNPSFSFFFFPFLFSFLYNVGNSVPGGWDKTF